MTLEDFETETTGAQSFSEGGINFVSTADLKVEFSTGFGAGSSDKWLGTVAGNGGSAGNVGSIQISTPSTSFSVTNFAAWTSNNDGNNRATGNVTFTGTLAAGGTAMETITIAPTADDGTGYVTVTFVGALSGAAITALSVTLPGNLNYIAIDNFNFTTAAIVTNQYSINDVSILEGNSPGTTNFTFTISRTSNAAAGSVQLQTANGTASSASDYTAVPLTTINFPMGGTLTMMQTVVVQRDNAIEPNETFFVNLSNPMGGTILDNQGIGTILDDDEICEEFEDETDGSTSFSQNGIVFTSNGDLEVEFSNGFGSGGSDFWLGTVAGNGGTSGAAGSILISTPGTSFNVTNIDAWTSNDDGTLPTPGTVTFTGLLAAGGTIQHNAMISPSGNNFVTVNFSATTFNNTQLVGLTMSISGGLNYLALDNLKFGSAVLLTPEMSVTGNGNPIDDGGGNSPSGTNHTDFGTLCVDGGMLTRTFMIVNSGSANLVLDGTPKIALSGHTADFMVTLDPTSPVLQAGATSFSVKFDPTTGGTRTVTVSIENNDLNEDPYNFALSGIGNATDSDMDGTPDCNDGCPNDPAKTAPGVCGCGISDDDADMDGTADCNDGCPLDPDKTAPGICGCGVSDDDTDMDGTLDCNDGCPLDPDKTVPGICGCGVSDDDTDMDGTLDCNDGCPLDPDKTVPGICGCGVSDDDTDMDGTMDCNDGCPLDPDKTAPGICGCGVSDDDTDMDGTADCNDGCPLDPDKTAPGICGCGVSDDDSDMDGTADCNDGCPNDPDKTAPGVCGCGVSDDDTDMDGTADCNDGCPLDPAKTAPGDCGCGNPEPGTLCDDGNPDTIDDVVNTSCMCEGELVGDPPQASCGVITVYVDPNSPEYDGPGTQNIWWIPADDLDGGSLYSSVAPDKEVRRNLSNITFNWTTAGACIDVTPNTTYNNNDKGIVYRDCLPVTNSDFNKWKLYKLRISDQFGTDECNGSVRVVPQSALLAESNVPVIIHYVLHDELEPPAEVNIDVENAPLDVLVYPNPGTDMLTLLWDVVGEEQEVGVRIFDLSGKMTSLGTVRHSPGTNQVVFDMQQFHSGMYFIQIEFGDRHVRYKWIKH